MIAAVITFYLVVISSLVGSQTTVQCFGFWWAFILINKLLQLHFLDSLSSSHQYLRLHASTSAQPLKCFFFFNAVPFSTWTKEKQTRSNNQISTVCQAFFFYIWNELKTHHLKSSIMSSPHHLLCFLSWCTLNLIVRSNRSLYCCTR